MEKLIVGLLLAASMVGLGEVKLEAGRISEYHWTPVDRHQLDVELNLSGRDLGGCKALRVVLHDAKDDAGRTLKQVEGIMGKGFVTPRPGMTFFGGELTDAGTAVLQLDYAGLNSKSLDLDGEVEILLPAKDPASVISVNLLKDGGKPVGNPKLKAAGAIISFRKAGSRAFSLALDPAEADREGQYYLNDPNHKVGAVEFLGGDGKTIEATNVGAGSLGNGYFGVTVQLKKIPKIAKIYLATEKSVVRVPIKLKEVPIPKASNESDSQAK